MSILVSPPSRSRSERSGDDGTKSAGVVFHLSDSALPPYMSALHTLHSSQVHASNSTSNSEYHGSYLLLAHHVGEVLMRALRHIVRVRIMILPEAPMTPAIAGCAPPSAPSARDEPSVSEE
jgi:hypothetical protein